MRRRLLAVLMLGPRRRGSETCGVVSYIGFIARISEVLRLVEYCCRDVESVC